MVPRFCWDPCIARRACPFSTSSLQSYLTPICRGLDSPTKLPPNTIAILLLSLALYRLAQPEARLYRVRSVCSATIGLCHETLSSRGPSVVTNGDQRRGARTRRGDAEEPMRSCKRRETGTFGGGSICLCYVVFMSTSPAPAAQNRGQPMGLHLVSVVEVAILSQELPAKVLARTAAPIDVS